MLRICFRFMLLVLIALIELLTLDLRSASADCQGDNNWLPTTPSPTFERPLPHPAPDCGFYRPAWQNFLDVTQVKNGKPAFLSFSTIPDVFPETSGVHAKSIFAAKQSGLLSLAPRALKGSNDPTTDATAKPGPNTAATINAGVRQAGFAGLLIDQNGRPIFYAIHMNDAFAAFIRDNHLTTKPAVQNADPDLVFTKGSVELKSAWQVIPKGSDRPNYITTQAGVPVLKRNGDTLEIDLTKPPTEQTVALLAIHVVFVLEGHPEFVWATFEHVDANGMRDVAPAAAAQPSDDNGLPGGADGPVSGTDFTLYKAGTLASTANQIIPDAAMASGFDEGSESFVGGGKPLQTSIYRIFPASKTADIRQMRTSRISTSP